MDMTTGRRNWSEEEVRLALALYLRTPFGRMHRRNPQVIALARYLQRTPAAVALKLCNLAALDDSLPRAGMRNASRADRRVWRRFRAAPDSLLPAWRKLMRLLGEAECADTVSSTLREERELPLRDTLGREREVVVRQRIGQDMFRRAVLASYEGRCALTGIDDARLLTASHIVPWREAPEIRLDPCNGICLNALHDRAFDRHLITFDEDWRLVISPCLPARARHCLLAVEEPRLRLPRRFLPSREYMERHRHAFHLRQEAP